MKDFKFYYLFAFALLGLVVTSCSDDEDDDHGDNMITITIEEPVDGENIPVANCADVHVHVEFSASVENHEVEIVLHPEGDTSTKIIDFSMHEHDMEIEFEQEVDLCTYNAGDCFHLEVEACVDHDCEEKATAEAEFCLE